MGHETTHHSAGATTEREREREREREAVLGEESKKSNKVSLLLLMRF